MLLSYLVAVVAGIAIGFTVVANQTLTESRSSPKKYPKMKAGEPLTRRYIEVMGVAVLLWIGGAIYLFVKASQASVVLALLVAAVSYPLCKRLDDSVQTRYGR